MENKDQCSVCGGTEELMTVIRVDTDKVKWGFGIYVKIDENTIISTTRYCNACMLERVWYKNGTHNQG